MARTNSIYDSYESGSAQERAELIYKHFCSFEAIIEDIKERLIYDIQVEEQFIRGQHKDELGVRIQRLGGHSDPTANEATDNVMLEKSADGEGDIYLSIKLPLETQMLFERKYHVIKMMRQEYKAFVKHLHALEPEEQEVIIPILKHSKDYLALSEETGISRDVLRKRVSTLHKEFIEDMAEYYVERI